MATRFYLPSSSAAPPISPTDHANWTAVGTDFYRATMSTSKTGTALTNKSFGSSSAVREICAQFISEPLAAQTLDGTVAWCIRVAEVAASDNMFYSIAIRVFNSAGSTVRGTFYADIDTSGLGTEWPTTSASRYVLVADASTTSVSVQVGDYLVVEFGGEGDFTDLNWMRFGDDASTDYPASDGDTTASNPWIEFSQDIAFKSTNTNRLMLMGHGT